MYSNSYANSLEAEVMSASPVRLVHLLYRGALDAVRAARTELRAGDIPARSRAITKAQAIINELASSLNCEQGGEFARNLQGLYSWLLERLTAANLQQREQPLIEAEQVLQTLESAWREISSESEYGSAAAIVASAGHAYQFAGCIA